MIRQKVAASVTHLQVLAAAVVAGRAGLINDGVIESTHLRQSSTLILRDSRQDRDAGRQQRRAWSPG